MSHTELQSGRGPLWTLLLLGDACDDARDTSPSPIMPQQELEQARPSPLYSLVGAMLLLVAAWYSVGYHGEDEHHQTIGLALARAGELPPNEVVWEYGERIRSSALPWVVTGLFQLTEALGLTGPFTRTWLLRLLTAAPAWGSPAVSCAPRCTAFRWNCTAPAN